MKNSDRLMAPGGALASSGCLRVGDATDDVGSRDRCCGARVTVDRGEMVSGIDGIYGEVPPLVECAELAVVSVGEKLLMGDTPPGDRPPWLAENGRPRLVTLVAAGERLEP